MTDGVIMAVWNLEPILKAAREQINSVEDPALRQRLESLYTQTLTQGLISADRGKEFATMPLKNIIRNARRTKNLTLQEVSNSVGKSKTWVCDLERGRHRPVDKGVLIKLAALLGLDWQTLREIADHERREEQDTKAKP